MTVALMPTDPTTAEAAEIFGPLSGNGQDWLLGILARLDCDISAWDKGKLPREIPAAVAVTWANALRVGLQDPKAGAVGWFLSEYPDDLEWVRSFERFLGYSGGFRMVGA